jgi:glutamate dehydrogenase (NAD(P)+)
MTAIVQGFGNVGSVAAEGLAALGVKIVGVGDRTNALVREEGLDIPSLIAHANANGGGIDGFPGGEAIPQDDLLTQRCDLLVPAALGGVITTENAGQLQCRAVLECANGPTVPKADPILRERGIVALPDLLVNAGGVTVSYFEWVQDTQHFFWEAEEVDKQLRKIMTRAFDKVNTLAKEKNVSLRIASLMLGVSRLAESKRLRGLYP